MLRIRRYSAIAIALSIPFLCSCKEVVVPRSDTSPPEARLFVYLPDGSQHVLTSSSSDLTVPVEPGDKIVLVAVVSDDQGVAYAGSLGSMTRHLTQGGPFAAVQSGTILDSGAYSDPAQPGATALAQGSSSRSVVIDDYLTTSPGQSVTSLELTFQAHGENAFGLTDSSASVSFEFKP